MNGTRKKIVFLGTPAIAALALKKILDAEKLVQVIAVVSQPPARAARGGGTVNSPVHQVALEHGIHVFTPESAKDTQFLSDLAALEPDLCITAAYGNVLPEAFLKIPKFGTLNIHPSLLPKYRGAAPVQRALEDGVEESGVTILYTVRAMDAGPIVFQKRWTVDLVVKAPEMLKTLFELGADVLVEGLPRVFDGSAPKQEQDARQATHAKKIAPEEGILNFSEAAKRNHNKVRAFAGWPGTRAKFEWDGEVQEVKVVTTRFPAMSQKGSVQRENAVTLDADALVLTCGDGQGLEILEIQAPGKRVLSAKDFWNGLKSKKMRWVP